MAENLDLQRIVQEAFPDIFLKLLLSHEFNHGYNYLEVLYSNYIY